jgi:hypothetical protein
MFRVVLIFVFSIVFVFADNEPNNGCSQVEVIEQLDGLSANVSHTESGLVHGSDDRYDYYSFVVNASGTLQVSFGTNKTANSIFFGTSCDGSNLYSNTSNSTSKTGSFSVTSGQTVHVKIERRYNTWMSYDLSINFLSGTVNEAHRNFSQRWSDNLRGSMVTLGNTILVPPTTQNSTICNSYTNGSYYTDVSSANNYYYLCGYIKDTGTFNSTSAELSVPAGSEIVWAGLYWQALIDNSDENDILTMNPRIKRDNGSYQNVGGFDQLDYVDGDGKSGYISYSAFKNVTRLFKEQNWHNAGSATFTVADIPVEEGKIDNLGTYGAWTMVVVYKNLDETLKNITVFDGWRKVANATGFTQVDVDVSGFMTPFNGDVYSKTSVFAAEGDKHISNDYLYAKPSKQADYQLLSNTTNQTFNSSITTPGIRVPSLLNNNGIDIQQFELGEGGYEIMGNEESSVTFRFTSNQDTYWPSMISFETELYEPRVCYEQEIKNTQIEDGEPVEFNIWIKNLPKEGDTTVEAAHGVQISTILDSRLDFDSMTVEHIYDENETKVKYWVGDGAALNNGGTVQPYSEHLVELIAYPNVIEDEMTINNVYKITYRNDDLGLEFNDIDIDECVEFDSSISIKAGEFNVVHSHNGSDLLPKDSNSTKFYKNSLLTQISGKPFDVDVVSLDPTDFETPKNFSGYIKLDVVNSSDLKSKECAAVGTKFGTPTSILFNNETKKTAVDFIVPKSSMDARFRVSIIDYEKSWQKIKDELASFPCEVSEMDANLMGVPQCLSAENQVDTHLGSDVAEACFENNGRPCFPANGGIGAVPFNHDYGCADCLLYEMLDVPVQKSVCSRDNFAIRPAKLVLEVEDPSLELIAGKDYNYSIKALTFQDQLDEGYQLNDVNATYFSPSPQMYFRNLAGGIGTMDENNELGSESVVGNDSNFKFDRGLSLQKITSAVGKVDPEYVVPISFDNVGYVDMILIDNKWTAVDQNVSMNPVLLGGQETNIDDCIADSTDNNHTNFSDSYVVKRLVGCNIEGRLGVIKEFIPDHFTFDSLSLSDNSGLVTYLAYDEATGGVQSDMMAFMNFEVTARNLKGAATSNYDSESNASKSKYANPVDINMSFVNNLITYADQNATVEVIQAEDINFSNGTSNHRIGFNFFRDANTPHEPFDLNQSSIQNFDIQIEDTKNSIIGNETNSSLISNKTNFYYANIYAPDIVTSQSPVNAIVYVEVFCQNGGLGIDCSSLGNSSVERLNWWRFGMHQVGSGSIDATSSEQGNVAINPDEPGDIGATQILQVTNNSGNDNYKTKIIMEPSPWLSYHPYIPFSVLGNQQNFFFIEWNSAAGGNWEGVGNLGQAVDSNGSGMSRQNHNRINW